MEFEAAYIDGDDSVPVQRSLKTSPCPLLAQNHAVPIGNQVEVEQ